MNARCGGQAPHPTAAVEALMQPIRQAEMDLVEAERFLAVLEMRAGQDCASIRIGSVSVDLTCLGPSYMPQPVSGTQRLREAAIAWQRDLIISRRSKLEGLRWKLKQATKAVAP